METRGSRSNARTRRASQIAPVRLITRRTVHRPARFGVINNYETELLKKAATRAYLCNDWRAGAAQVCNGNFNKFLCEPPVSNGRVS